MEAAGFINIHGKNYEVPLGTWTKHPIMKYAGRIGMQTYKAGMEGFIIYFATSHGAPEPWTPEQVHVYLGVCGRSWIRGCMFIRI